MSLNATREMNGSHRMYEAFYFGDRSYTFWNKIWKFFSNWPHFRVSELIFLYALVRGVREYSYSDEYIKCNNRNIQRLTRRIFARELQHRYLMTFGLQTIFKTAALHMMGVLYSCLLVENFRKINEDGMPANNLLSIKLPENFQEIRSRGRSPF